MEETQKYKERVPAKDGKEFNCIKILYVIIIPVNASARCSVGELYKLDNSVVEIYTVWRNRY